jgi:signal transduction histidine kinase
MRDIRLQYQIALATFLPLLLFGLSSVGLGTYALTVIPRNLILQRQVALSQVAAAGVVANLQGHLRLLEATADELGRYTGDMSGQRQILWGRERIFSTFSGGVGLMDNNGTVIATTSSAEANLGMNFASRSYFTAVLANGASVFSTVLQDEPRDKPAVLLAVPVRQKDTLVGVLVGEFFLDQSDWARDLDLLRTPQGGRAYIVDKTGTIIYHPDTSRIGTNIQADAVLWRLVLRSAPQSALYRPPDTRRQLVVAFVPIPDVPWGLIVEEPWQAILASSVPYQWGTIGLMVLGLVLSLASLLLSTRRVTRPITALVSEGQRVAAGEPFQPLVVEGPSDLRVLLRVVNQMVARLAEQQATLRRYALQVLTSQEDERKRLSRDLHDETAQALVALNQRIELCRDVLDKDPQAAKRRLGELQELAQRSLSEVRRMSNALRPSILEDLGLSAALRALTTELRQELPQVQAHCEIVGSQVRLPPELELTVYRIGQEALSNVRKHAGVNATRVNVALFFEAWGVMLLVEDNGPGFAAPSESELVAGGHLGLMGMRERAQLFQGELTVTSAPGEGTTVSLRLPWPTQPHGPM